MATLGGRLLGFKRHLQAAVVPGEAAYLVSARGVTALRGRAIEVLAPLLDGSRTVAGIVRDAAPELSPDQVGALLARLAEARFLAFAEPEGAGEPAPRPALAYWELAGLDGATAARAVATTPVELIEVGPVDRAAVEAALAGSGLHVQSGGSPAPLTVVLCDDYLDPRLAEIDRGRRGDGRPWLLARTSGPDLWIGPIFRPGAGPCWHCLAQRLAELRQADLRAVGAAGVRLPEASIAAARAVAAQLAVLEAAKWLAGVREAGQDAVYTLDTLTLTGRHHPVTRRPQCPECGDPTLVAGRARQPVVPGPRPRAAGGDRALDAQDLYDRYRHLVDPVSGVVRELVDQERADGFVYRCAASSYVAVPGGSHGTGALLRTLSAGKGATVLAARVGALGEAVERHCAVRQGDEAVVLGSYRDLAPAAVHPDSVQLHDQRQYADRDRWNHAHGAAHWVCEPFDEGAIREWTPVWSLTRQCERLLPTALLYFHHGRAGACRQVWADSTGNAAGASLEDAIVAGFLEIVERDAVALWWYNRSRQPGIDLDGCDDPLVARAREVCARGGREFWALDLSADLPVSVVAAVSAASGDRPARPLIGFGAHFDRRIALRRAVAELGQIAAVLHPVDAPAALSEMSLCPARLPALAGALSGSGTALAEAPGARPKSRIAHPPLEQLRWWQALGQRPPAYLRPDPDRPLLSGGDPGPHVRPSHPDLHEDVEHIVGLVRAAGLEMLVLDQTRPDVGMPVVKVLIPGMRTVRARFAPGRLFDVPVALGRRARPLEYHELNPVPLVI